MTAMIVMDYPQIIHRLKKDRILAMVTFLASLVLLSGAIYGPLPTQQLPATW